MNLNIEKSTKINQARLLKMKERNNRILLIKEDTKEQLLKTKVNPTNPEYKACMKKLIIQVSISFIKTEYLSNLLSLQGMIKLLEPELQIKCKKEDVSLIKGL